jgi:Icc-related predicted phosphoesterase
MPMFPAMIMRILAIADIHSDTDFALDPENMGIDLVVTLGDVPMEMIEVILLRKRSVPYLGVNGNHDQNFVPRYANAHRKVFQIAEMKIGGFEGAPRIPGEPRYHAYSQRQVNWRMKLMPRVDIFLAHNAPRGIHDLQDPLHIGFVAFRTYIEKRKPRLFLHGHVERSEESLVGETRVISVFGKRIIDLEGCVGAQHAAPRLK